MTTCTASGSRERAYTFCASRHSRFLRLHLYQVASGTVVLAEEMQLRSPHNSEACTQTRVDTRLHTHTHICTYTHIHTHVRAHTHTHKMYYSHEQRCCTGRLPSTSPIKAAGGCALNAHMSASTVEAAESRKKGGAQKANQIESAWRGAAWQHPGRLEMY